MRIYVKKVPGNFIHDGVLGFSGGHPQEEQEQKDE